MEIVPQIKKPMQPTNPYVPCVPLYGPCGRSCCCMDPHTMRRPLIVHDSTFDYRPTSTPEPMYNYRDPKVRYELVNYDKPLIHPPCCNPHCC